MSCIVQLYVHLVLYESRFPEGQGIAQPEGVVGPGAQDYHGAWAESPFGLGIEVEANSSGQLDHLPGTPLGVDEPRAPKLGGFLGNKLIGF